MKRFDNRTVKEALIPTLKELGCEALYEVNSCSTTSS